MRTLWGGVDRDSFYARNGDERARAGENARLFGEFEFATSGDAIAGNVRLTDRESFSGPLGLEYSSVRDLSDSDLLLLGYKKWGEALPVNLGLLQAAAILLQRSSRLSQFLLLVRQRTFSIWRLPVRAFFQPRDS
jgi:hypothetical protein